MIRLISWNVRAWWKPWYLPIGLMLFAFIGWQGGSLAVRLTAHEQLLITLWDGVALALAGPALHDRGFLELLRWLIPQLVFLYLVGDTIQLEFAQQGGILIILTGSRMHWWLGKILALMLMALGYWTLALIATASGARLAMLSVTDIAISNTSLSIMPNLTPVSLIGHILFLMVTTSFSLALLQTGMALWLRNSIFGIGLILLILIISWLLGTSFPEANYWLPGSQSMLLRHWQLNDFSVGWSLVYNIILACLAGFACTWRLMTMDIFADTNQ